VYARLRPGADPAARRSTAGEAARRYGVADPVVYLDDGRDGRALAALTAAVASGRHNAVLLAGLGGVRGCPEGELRRLLLACTRCGVAVDILPAGSWRRCPPRPGAGRAWQCDPVPGVRVRQARSRKPGPLRTAPARQPPA
jgi:hypothetical protein